MRWLIKRKKVEEPKLRLGIIEFPFEGKVYNLLFKVSEDLGNGYYSVTYLRGGNSKVYSAAPSILPDCNIRWMP